MLRQPKSQKERMARPCIFDCDKVITYGDNFKLTINHSQGYGRIGLGHDECEQKYLRKLMGNKKKRRAK